MSERTDPPTPPRTARRVLPARPDRFTGDADEAKATLDYLRRQREEREAARDRETLTPDDGITVEDAGVATGEGWVPPG